MSRSFKKIPIGGVTCSESDKPYKKIRHGQERARVRTLLAKDNFDLLNQELAPYNAWDAPKDGKTNWFDLKKKNPKLYRKLMRK